MRPYFTFLDSKVDNAEGLFRFCCLTRKEENPGLEPLAFIKSFLVGGL